MPIYEYKCGACSKRIEKVQSINSPNPRCPICFSSMEKVISPIGSYAIKGDNSASTSPKTTVRSKYDR